MFKTSSLMVAAAASLLPMFAAAKTLYVNNSGSPACSDATTYTANSATSPWCTIGRAAWGSTNRAAQNASQAAQAGDVVSIAAGTYVTTSNVTACGGVRWEVALNPANSGTAASPITFRGNGNVNIYLGAGHAGPTIGANSRNYIVWDNVRIDEQVAQGVSCSDTGPVVFFMSNGSKIINSYIRATNRSWGDNYSAIRTEYVTGLQIANNEIRDVAGNMGENNAAWLMYDTADSVFENNYVYNCTTGIYVKGDHTAAPVQQNITIRYNWFENNSDFGIFLLAGFNTRIYQNVIKGSRFGIRHFPSSSSNSVIANNVFVATTNQGGGYSAFAQTPVNTRVFNNIFVGPWGEAINLGDLGTVSGHSFQHNVYSGYSTFGSVTSTISFATWQSTYAQDTVSPAGVSQNPNFVSTSYPGGYKLSAGSPALSRGIDILDLNSNSSTADAIPAGAYITGTEVIGRTSGAAPPPPTLPAPTNLRFL